ncbi:MAG: histidine kinase, partial [Cyclobacteriaceae bacterium]
ICTQVYGQHSKFPEVRRLQEKLNHINMYDTAQKKQAFEELIMLCREYDDYHNLINHLTEYGKFFIGIMPDYDQAFYYIDQAEKLAIKHQYTEGLAKALLFKAYYYNVFNKMEASIDYIRLAKNELNKVAARDDLIIKKNTFYLLVGDIYKVFNLFDSSLYNYNVALDESIRVGDIDFQYRTELRIADLLESIQGDYTTSAEIYRRVLAEADADSKYVSISARKLADIMMMENKVDSAKNLLRLSYRINRKSGSTLTFIASPLSRIFSSEGRPDSALYYLQKAEELPHTDLGELQMDIGYSYAYQAMGDYTLALYYNDRAREKTITKPENDLVREVLNQRVQIEISQEDYKSAFASLKQLKQWEDSLMNFSRQKDLFALENKYENDAAIRDLVRKNEIAQLELKQRNLQLIIVIVVLVSLLLIGYLIYNRRSIKQDKQTNELNLKLLRLQLNPHFIFNALSSIQSFIMTNNNREASVSLAKFGELTRDILDSSNETNISLEKETKILQNYVDVQKTRFEGEIIFTITTDDSLELSTILIPPMFIQPFIENAFEHGLDRKKGGRIDLNIARSGEALSITIADDGGGLVKSGATHQHKSVAISVIRKRLARLNSRKRKLKPLEIKNRIENGVIVGVIVQFELPLKETF